MCESVALALSKRGYEVVFRTAAEEAFDLLMKQDFDVVVTDLNMRALPASICASAWWRTARTCRSCS
jgi:CheY-like chemotaxis protein